MTPRAKQSYAGRRVARPAEAEQAQTVELTVEPTRETPVDAAAESAASVAFNRTESGTHHFNDLDVTAELPLERPPAGKRKAVRHAGSRGPLFRGLPSPPVLLGVAVLAISIGGAISSAGPELASNDPDKFQHASALSGTSGVGTVSAYSERDRPVSRESQRDALEDSASADLVAEAEQQALQRDAALGQLAKSAEGWASKLAENRWQLPLAYSEITATFGEYGLWSSYHTGLDFNGDTGDQIMAIANGVITETGYDGSYGNKTVLTLDDGTEVWFCHQTDIYVEPGEVVTAGEVIGTVGTTGHVTGSHLHIEVRPGGGDPVDPYEAFVVHGVTP